MLMVMVVSAPCWESLGSALRQVFPFRSTSACSQSGEGEEAVQPSALLYYLPCGVLLPLLSPCSLQRQIVCGWCGWAIHS